MRIRKTFLIFDGDWDNNNEQEPLLEDMDDDEDWQVLFFIFQ